MRFFLLFTSLLIMVGCTPLKLNWAGLYDTKVMPIATPGPATKVNIPRSRLIARQDRIPAQTGMLFGLNFTLPGAMVGEEVTLRKVVRFPAPGLTTPQGQLLTQSESTVKARKGYPFTTGYRLREDWEVQEGEWIFEIWRDGQLLLNHSFNVTRSQPAPAEQEASVSVESPQCPQLTYPIAAYQKKAMGETQILFTIKGDGAVEDVSLLVASGTTLEHSELDTTVINAFKMCRFNPVRGIELYYLAQTVKWVLQ